MGADSLRPSLGLGTSTRSSRIGKTLKMPSLRIMRHPSTKARTGMISTMTITFTTTRITEVGDFRATKGVMLQEPHFFLNLLTQTHFSSISHHMPYDSISFHFRSDTHVQHVNTASLSLTHTDSTLFLTYLPLLYFYYCLIFPGLCFPGLCTVPLTYINPSYLSCTP